MEERLAKTEMNAERSLDEIFYLRDQLKHLSEDRKKDVEETADFIKQNNKLRKRRVHKRVAKTVGRG